MPHIQAKATGRLRQKKTLRKNTSQSDGTNRNDSSDKPTVNISWREGIHVIDPNKGEEVHVGWNGIHVTNKRKNEEVLVGPGGVHVDTPDDGIAFTPTRTAR